MDLSLTLLKLGGSLVTDKAQAQTARPAAIARLAEEIAAGLAQRPDLRLLLGHGSGSFGHVEAQKYGTREGVRTSEAWRGFLEVAAIAAQLNRLVYDALRAAAVPVFNLPPSASAVCRHGSIISLALNPVRVALDEGLVPLVYGDVAVDVMQGGTIISTEEVFRYLAEALQPATILLAGVEPGVLTHYPGGEVIPEISPGNFEQLRAALRGSAEPDVTGGMESKVLHMLAQAQEQPGLHIRIFSGETPGLLTKMLAGESADGTLIHAPGVD